MKDIYVLPYTLSACLKSLVWFVNLRCSLGRASSSVDLSVILRVLLVGMVQYKWFDIFDVLDADAR